MSIFLTACKKRCLADNSDQAQKQSCESRCVVLNEKIFIKKPGEDGSISEKPSDKKRIFYMTEMARKVCEARTFMQNFGCRSKFCKFEIDQIYIMHRHVGVHRSLLGNRFNDNQEVERIKGHSQACVDQVNGELFVKIRSLLESNKNTNDDYFKISQYLDVSYPQMIRRIAVRSLSYMNIKRIDSKIIEVFKRLIKARLDSDPFVRIRAKEATENISYDDCCDSLPKLIKHAQKVIKSRKEYGDRSDNYESMPIRFLKSLDLAIEGSDANIRRENLKTAKKLFNVTIRCSSDKEKNDLINSVVKYLQDRYSQNKSSPNFNEAKSFFLGLRKNDKPDIAKLISYLKGQNVHEKVEAAKELAVRGSDKQQIAAELLKIFKNRKNVYYLKDVVRIFLKIDEKIEELVSILIGLLRDYRIRHRFFIFESLELIGPRAKSAIPALLAILRKAKIRNRGYAISVLAAIGEGDEIVRSFVLREVMRRNDISVARALFKVAPEKGVSMLKSALLERNWPRAWVLFYGLCWSKQRPREIIPAVYEAISNTNNYSRGLYVLYHLGERGEKFLKLLKTSLFHSNYSVRDAAVGIFIRSNSLAERAYSDLFWVLYSPNRNLRERAARIFADLGHKAQPFIPHLIWLLKNDSSQYVRRQAAIALSKIDPNNKNYYNMLSTLYPIPNCLTNPF